MSDPYDEWQPGREPDDDGGEPPQNLAAERAVLGACMQSPDAISEVVEIIRPVDFYRPNHETIYDAVLDLYGRGEPVDAITVGHLLQQRGEFAKVGGGIYLYELTAAAQTPASAGYHAAIVRDRAILRRLAAAGTQIHQLAHSGSDDVEAVVDRAEAAIYDVTQHRTAEDYLPVGEVVVDALDEIEAAAGRGGGITGVPTGFADLDELTNGLHPGQLVVVAARPSLGKALALDTPLPTPTGWTTMGEVQVGDLLIGADGQPTRVVAATEVMHGRPCYEVAFRDGERIVADAEHQWFTWDRRARRCATNPGDYRRRVDPAVRTTAEIAETLYDGSGRLNHSIPVAGPLTLPDADLPLPPYTLGAWLGDGHSKGQRITSADPEVPAAIEAEGMIAKPLGDLLYSLVFPSEDSAPAERICPACGTSFVPDTNERVLCSRKCNGRRGHVVVPRCAQCGERASGRGPLCQRCRLSGTVNGVLRGLDVFGNKHIPVTYLRASEGQRRALLAGLLDTDGTVHPSGQVQYTSTSRRLAEDVRELVVSLGYRCSVATRAVRGRGPESSTAFTLTFTAHDEVFRLSRKCEAHASRRRPTHATRSRTVCAVAPVPSVPVRCVQVDAADHLYLAGRAMVPTHNSTLALDWCRNAAFDYELPSVIFSLEMSRIEITMKLLSARARVPLHNIRTGHMSQQDWERVARKMDDVTNAPLYIDDSPNLTMTEIRAKARRLKQRHGLRLVVVDYLQLMTSGRRVENRQVEVSEFSRQMKLLAKELEVPVVALSQLNRGSEQRADKRPLLSDLRESGAIEQDADVVVFIHRDDAYERESTRPGEADLIVAKHRNGPTRDVTVAFQGHYSRFVDMAH